MYGPEYIRTERPKALKPHRCCECKRIIEPGENYEKDVGCWEGEWQTYKTCLNCKGARDALMQYQDEFVYESLLDHLSEYRSNPVLGELAENIRRQWRR